MIDKSLLAEAQADIVAQAKRGYSLKEHHVVHAGLSMIYSKRTADGEVLKMTYVCKGQMLSKEQLFFVLDCGYEKVRVKMVTA